MALTNRIHGVNSGLTETMPNMQGPNKEGFSSWDPLASVRHRDYLVLG